MIKKVVDILNSFGYNVAYSPYHRIDEFEKDDLDKEKNLCFDKFFTVYSKAGLVVLRIHNCPEGSEFQAIHAKEIIKAFKMYEIPHQEEIINSLEKLEEIN